MKVCRQDQQCEFYRVETREHIAGDDHRHELSHSKEVRLVMKRVLRMESRESAHPVLRFLADPKQVARQSLGYICVVPSEATLQLLPQGSVLD